jgi:hypothetical protein
LEDVDETAADPIVALAEKYFRLMDVAQKFEPIRAEEEKTLMVAGAVGVVGIVSQPPGLLLDPQVGLVQPIRADFGDKGVLIALVDLIGGHYREVGRIGLPNHVGVAGGIHGNAIAHVPVVPTEVGGVNQG